MRHLCLALIALLATIASPAAAQQVWPIMVQVGLIGTWAGNCDAPPSGANWFLTFRDDGAGGARRSSDRGPELPNLMVVIDSAQIPGPATVRFAARNEDVNWGGTNGHRFDVVVEISNGTMRTISSTRLHDGAELIKDGLVTSSGQPALLLRRCR
ncbi:MAG: hypothetical protein JO055_05535 [Alphaproteobacteria bacterium]|nr:hypothetical protein [Alphaproteobacteria bacterium]